MCKKTEAPTVTLELSGDVDVGLAEKISEAKKKEKVGKVIYDALVSNTKKATKLMFDAVPEIAEVAGVSPILLVDKEGIPLLKLGKAKAENTLDVSEFLNAVLLAAGREPAEVHYIVSALVESSLMELINIKATEAKNSPFTEAYTANLTSEATGARVLTAL